MRPCRSEGEGDERREMKEERGMVKKSEKDMAFCLRGMQGSLYLMMKWCCSE